MKKSQDKSKKENSVNHLSTPNNPIAIIAPCVDLEFNAPIRWLKLAWNDFKRAPKVSITWGLIIATISAIVAFMAFKLGKFALLALLLSGFTYVAPLMGIGLYSVTRELDMNKQPSLAYSLKFIGRLIPHASGFFIVQLVILLLWSRSGMIVTAFFPTTEAEQTLFWESLKSGQILITGKGSAFLHFLLLGSAIGSIFAGLIFCLTAVSLPMLADKKTDMVAVILSSINACLRNKWTMLLWAIIICALLALGILTFFIGYIIIMPLLGYGAWHAYRETLDASAWESRKY